MTTAVRTFYTIYKNVKLLLTLFCKLKGRLIKTKEMTITPESHQFSVSISAALSGGGSIV